MTNIVYSRYRPFITAEISLDDLKASDDAVGDGPGIKEETERAQRKKAEVLLERYLALGNDREEFFELTTPLFISEKNTYNLMVPGYKVGLLPECLAAHPNGDLCVLTFHLRFLMPGNSCILSLLQRLNSP